MTVAAPAARMPLKQRLLRVGKRILRVLLVAYVLGGLLLYLLQTRLIFIGHSRQATADAVVDPPAGTELVHLQAADGVPIMGLFGKAQLPNGRDDPAAASRPTVIFFYGNAMCMADAIGELALFREAGANCILVEYEGYGMSGGEPSEQGCYQAAEAAYQHLQKRTDVDGCKIIPAGWSLGGAVAIDLAAKHKDEGRICGLITFCSFTSMPAMAQYHYPMFPASWLLKHRFASEEKLAGITAPYLIGHGRHDSIIPYRMSDRLASAAKGPVTRFSLETDHNDFFELGEKEIREAVGAFLRQFD